MIHRPPLPSPLPRDGGEGTKPEKVIHANGRFSVVRVIFPLLIATLILGPYALLFWISCGSGWSFPALLPERMDFGPWRNFLADRDGLRTAILTSTAMSLVVGLLGTAGGLIVGRAVQRTHCLLPRFVIYLPFVVSPAIVGVGLYDLMIRLRLSGTLMGVMSAQLLFALSFASVFFSEFWSTRIERQAALVRNFGGSERDVWRHGILPQMSGLIIICFLQTALISWLDYALVSVIGGGHVSTVTMKLFAYLREANVNQAAQASLILLTPAWAGFLAMFVLYARRQRIRALHLEQP